MNDLPNKDTNVLCVWNDVKIPPETRSAFASSGVVNGYERAQTRARMEKGRSAGRKSRATRGHQPGQKPQTKTANTISRQIEEMRAYSNVPISGKALRTRKKGFREQVAEMRKAARIKNE